MRYTGAQFTLLLTEKCNLSCPYCFASDVLRGLDKQLLSLTEIRKLVDFVYTPETEHERTITLVGGEPSLHPEFHEIITYLLAEKFRLRIFTNGIWSKRKIDRILALDSASKRQIGFLVNYNHDIGRQPAERLDRFCQQVLPEFPATLGINVHRADPNHLATIDRCVQYKVNSLRFGISQPIGGQAVYVRFEDYPKIGDWLIEVIRYAVDREVGVFMDCSHPYCLFSEAQQRFIAKLQAEGRLGRHNAHCAAPLVVGPGLQTWRCYNRHDIAEKRTLADFKGVTALENYYSAKLNHWNIGRFSHSRCRDCRHRFDGSCHAGCAGFDLADEESLRTHIHTRVTPQLLTCILAINQDFIDSASLADTYFTIEIFGKKFRFPTEPYWELLNSLDGITPLREIMRATKIHMSDRHLSVIVKMIATKILRVVSIGDIDARSVLEARQ